MAISTIFYILMIIFFAGILYFGASKLFYVEEQTAKYSTLEYKKKITEIVRFCDEVTNKGSIKNINVESEILNSILRIKDDDYKNLFAPYTFSQSSTFFEEVSLIDKSVLLLKFDISSNTILNYKIIDGFDLRVNQNDLVINPQNKKYIDLRIECH